jgi:short chain dehydrogenase
VALGLDREEDFPANIEFRRFDVTDERASEQLAEEFPEIDALVNAAGVILHDNQEFSSDGFRKVMDINLGGTQLVTYAFKDALLKRKGAIVNFASLWSVFGSSKNPAYSASKGAVIRRARQHWIWNKSAELRNRLLQELSTYETDDALAVWAYRSLPLKNTLTTEDVEAAYLAKVGSFENAATAEPATNLTTQPPEGDVSLPSTKPVRKRSKAHLAFVASQPCLICKAAPCDAHHLKIARPRSLGRKVSDEFIVPLCRKHHRELHHHGNETNWWANMQVAPLPIAKELWEASPIHATTSLAATSAPAIISGAERNSNLNAAFYQASNAS